jgi:hypothetical protein
MSQGNMLVTGYSLLGNNDPGNMLQVIAWRHVTGYSLLENNEPGNMYRL